MTIKWKDSTFFTGRNGFFKCNGIDIVGTGADNVIMISPITSRGNIGRCDIAIPRHKIDELIRLLQNHKKL